jgi:aminoglycoside/choline kinase family phosphotransferase
MIGITPRSEARDGKHLSFSEVRSHTYLCSFLNLDRLSLMRQWCGKAFISHERKAQKLDIQDNPRPFRLA